MANRFQMPWWYLATLFIANLSLLLPNAVPLRVVGALLIIAVLPGLGWSNRLLTSCPHLLRWTIAVALSYTLTSLTTLLFYYLPGSVQVWQLLAVLNILAVLPLAVRQSRRIEDHESKQNRLSQSVSTTAHTPLSRYRLSPGYSLLIILGIALFLRLANLHYSEFQGDEALAMITAAEALEGHEDALFLRSKGPGEVLMPMAVWRLTGTINEPIARLPFTLAGFLAIVTIYMIGTEIGDQRVGWLAALFFSFNGFMVAFGRIVQYQALVVWMSAIALLMAVQWRKTGQQRFAILSGLCLGSGLLAHYDGILVLPAVAWLLVPGISANNTFSPRIHSIINALRSASLLLVMFLLTALPFYLPFALDPLANRTGDYVSERIGTELRNNLPDFFHFNTFYSSAYYIIPTSVLVLGLLVWYISRANRRRWWLSILVVVSVIVVTFIPDLLAGSTTDMSALPFALLLGGAFVSFFFRKDKSSIHVYIQALIAWLAIPFLGYNFVVALGLTHIYTIVPSWSLLAGLAWYHLFDAPNRTLTRRWPSWISNGLLGVWLIMATIFLWNAFIRHDVEYWQDFPAGNLRLFWTPYDTLPTAGFFGFAHRTGWKAIGQQIVAGRLMGDYGSNEEPDVTTWYTRGAARACDPQPEFYFLATDLIDPVEVPQEIIASNYQEIGSATLPNQKHVRIMQQLPSTLALNELDEARLVREFDRTATPVAFARSVRGTQPADTNFGNLISLVGYDLDTRRAYPGGRIPVTLYWQATASIPTSYQVFAHLEGDSGPVAQSDGVPVCWTYPTDAWRTGQIIADQHAILLATDISPGQYPLEIGLYLPGTLERLDVLDEASNPAGTSLTLTTLEIRN